MFSKHGVFVPSGARCCHGHLYNKKLSYDSIQQISASQDDKPVLNAEGVQTILLNMRSVLMNIKTFDFDDYTIISDESYVDLTGLTKGSGDIRRFPARSGAFPACSGAFQFNPLISGGRKHRPELGYIKHMRDSRIRSVRAALAIFLVKMRLDLSNRVFTSLFHLKNKRSVSHTIHSARLTLRKNFTHHYTGLQHVDRQTVIDHHQTSIASELFITTPDQLCILMDDTYIYIQKSSNNEMQRRTYSLHKHRHLVKPMMITTSVSFFC
ncbi:unnamed protein product [Rotaria socialis]|uniref:Uncharacterized protein n=1 Tax=Rotaria socialis TaxID=392032 RepID=A0A820EV08_9BILA|nr:unnamed protein product [Rotaria socialis]